jgi:hypothetical protein
MTKTQMAARGIFPPDLERELNHKYRCARCGKWYVEIDNIGQLRCRQQYFIMGKFWSVAADHIPMSGQDEHWREPVSIDQLKRSWVLYVYTDEPGDIVDIDSRYSQSLPRVDGRCVLRDSRYDEDKKIEAGQREDNVLTLSEHIQHAWVCKTESAPSADLMMGIAQALDDSDSDDEYESDEDSEGEESDRHEPSRSLRIVRYDIGAYENLRTRVWPKEMELQWVRREYGKIRAIPIHETPLWDDIRVVARTYGIGHEDWMRDVSQNEWRISRRRLRRRT